MPFFNREQELQFLNRKYREKGAQLIVVYGKRRVGKTELVKQFLKNGYPIGRPSAESRCIF